MAAFVVVGLTVESVVLSRVTETTPFVGTNVEDDVDDDDDDDVDTDEEFRCVGDPRCVGNAMTVEASVIAVDDNAGVVVGTSVDVFGVELDGDTVVGLAVVRRVVELGGGTVGLFFGSRESTTPTGPLRSISVSGHVISSG